ncbi:MAG: hypothetical protein NC489_23630 [Ruminococcus flavefaciens]|nr:hypothetical protein [Ruminococcus flavefaciens]
MSIVKERILGAVTVMTENDAQILWNIIMQKFSIDWDNIKTVEADSWDLQMLDEISMDPECHEFLSEKDAMKELGLA